MSWTDFAGNNISARRGIQQAPDAGWLVLPIMVPAYLLLLGLMLLVVTPFWIWEWLTRPAPPPAGPVPTDPDVDRNTRNNLEHLGD